MQTMSTLVSTWRKLYENSFIWADNGEMFTFRREKFCSSTLIFFTLTLIYLRLDNIYNNYSLQDFLCDQTVDLNP